MLSRIPVRRFSTLSLITCRASIAPRPLISRYLAPKLSHRRLLSDSPAATTAAKDRRWVMLSSYGRYRTDHASSSVAGDANTVAESRTSKGRRVCVSFRCAAPPSSSYLYYDFPDDGESHDRISVVSSNGELVLLELKYHYHPRSGFGEEYFVYRPAGARQPPSLSLLRDPEFPTKPDSVPASYFDPPIRRLRHGENDFLPAWFFEDPPIRICRPKLDCGGIGLLRRGENDLLLVHVDIWYDSDERWQMAVFSVLRPGMRQWELMKPVPISPYRLFGSLSPKDFICVGDRFLCSVWYCSNFLLCDMADEASPKVRDVELPLDVTRCRYGQDNSERVRRMGVAGDSSVRLVSIHPYCCSIERYDDEPDCCGCDEIDRSKCWHPRFVFTIKTWKMNLSTDEPLEWVEDGEIDCEELWSLQGYEGLPHAIPQWPVVCLGKANVVCFVVSNYDFTRNDEKFWMVQLNINTKTLLSVVELSSNNDYRREYYHLPAEFQY